MAIIFFLSYLSNTKGSLNNELLYVKPLETNILRNNVNFKGRDLIKLGY